MCDLELNLLFNLDGHLVKLRENKAIDNSTSRRPSTLRARARVELFDGTAGERYDPQRFGAQR